MSASASLIPELEDVIQHGSQDRRTATVKRIANLFIDGAPHFNEDHIGLFDDVLCRLIVEIETKARAEMAQTLAPLKNAPTELMRQLAHDDDIAVAGPVLTQSVRLKETELDKKDRKNRLLICHYASLGHPNQMGALIYAEAIKGKLQWVIQQEGWTRDIRRP